MWTSKYPYEPEYSYWTPWLKDLCKTEPIEAFIYRQQRRYLAHIIRQEDSSLVKTLTFNSDSCSRTLHDLEELGLKADELSEMEFYEQVKTRKI